jgi:hypothetical protein
MDWANERYVRNYTRDTADLIAVGWEGRFVFYELLRKVDRSGVLDYGDDLAVVHEILRLPPEVFAVALPRLLKKGCVIQRNGALVIPNFMEAQESAQADAARKRASRERGRARAMEPEQQPVTTGHTRSRNVTDQEREENDGVTDIDHVEVDSPSVDSDVTSHVRSHPVTFGHSDLCLTVPNRTVPTQGERARDPALPPPLPVAEKPAPSPVAKKTDASRQLVAEQVAQAHALAFNRVREKLGEQKLPAMKPSAKHVAAIRELLETRDEKPLAAEDECRHVLAVFEAEALAKRTLRWFGQTLWREGNVARAVAMSVEEVSRVDEKPPPREAIGYSAAPRHTEPAAEGLQLIGPDGNLLSVEESKRKIAAERISYAAEQARIAENPWLGPQIISANRGDS